MNPVGDADTLCAHQDEWDVNIASVGGELADAFVDFLEAGFVFQAEDKYDSLHPVAELRVE